MRRLEAKKHKTTFNALLDVVEAERKKKELERPARFQLDIDMNTASIVKAEAEVKAMKEELRELDNNSEIRLKVQTTSRLTDAQVELKKLQAQIAAIDKDIDIRAQMHVEKARAESAIRSLKAELDSVHETGANAVLIKADISDAERHIAELNDKLDKTSYLADKKHAVELETQKAQERIDTLQGQVDQYQKKAERVKDLRVNIKQASEGIQRLTAENDRMAKVLESPHAIQVEYKMRLDKANAALKAINKQILDLKNDATLRIDSDTHEAQAKIKALEAALQRMQDEAKVQARVDIKDAQGELAKLNSALKKTDDENAKINIKANMADVETKLDKLRAQLKEPHNVNIDAQLDRIAAVKTELERVTKDRQITLNAKLEGLETARARVEHQIHEMSQEVKVTVNADADTTAARMKLAVLAHQRIVNLWVRVTGVKEAEAVLKGLSGMRMLERFQDKLINIASNIDQVAYKTIVWGSTISYVASMAISALPAIIAFAHGFVQIAPLSLAAVAALGSVATAVGIVYMAFSKLSESGVQTALDLSNAWSDFKDQLTSLKEVVKEGFFTQETVNAMRRLTDTVIPQLNESFAKLSVTVGNTFTGLLDQMSSDFGDGKLTAFFDQVDEGFRNAHDGILAFTEGIANLGFIGGQFLPGIGDYITDLGNRFRDWTADTEHVNEVIDNARTQFGYLKTASEQLVGAFGAVLMASGEATDGFKGLSDAMTGLNEFLRDSDIQRGLTDLFEGAAAGAGGLMTTLNGMKPVIGDAFSNLGAILESFGGAFAELIAGIITMLAQPELKDGMAALGDSVKDALANIDWEQLGRDIGSVAQSISEAMPYIVDLFENIMRYVPGVADALSGFVQDLMPVVTAILPAIPVFVLLGGAMAALGKAVPGIISFGKAIGLLPKDLSLVATGFKGLKAAFGFITGPAGVVIAIIIAMIAVFVYLWNTNEEFRTAVKEIWEDIKTSIKTVVDWFKSDIVPAITPVLETLKTAFGVFAEVVGKAFVGWWNAMKPVVEWFVNEALPVILDGITLMVTHFTNGFDLIKTLWEALKEPIQVFVDWFRDVVGPAIQVVIDNIKNWFQSLSDKIGEIFGGLAALIQPFIDFLDNTVLPGIGDVWDKIMGKNDDLAGNTEGNWAKMEDSVKNHSVGMAAAASENVEGMSASVTASLNGMASSSDSTLSGWESTSVGHAGGMGSGVAQAVAAGLQTALGHISGFAANAQAATAGWGTVLFSSGASLVQGLIDGIMSKLGSVGAAVNAVMSAASAFMPQSPAKKGPFSGHGWTPYRGAAIVEGLTAGIEGATPDLVSSALRAVSSVSDAFDGVEAGMATYAYSAVDTSPLRDLGDIAPGLTRDDLEGLNIGILDADHVISGQFYGELHTAITRR